ncbi:MAG TPA: LON peptidase substrate-binding domain-containing protein [Acidimicrobiia bacterium]
MAQTLPMFPLGTVLFPNALLPLQIFEARYRAMTEAVLAGDGEFGVVLIERGSEVGGGDSRFGVGTVARIVEAARLPDGRFLLVATGTRRLRVRVWLPEEPYPRAEVDLLGDPVPAGDASDARVAVEALLDQLYGLRAALGEGTPPGEVRLDGDLIRASYEAAAAAGLGPLDAQRLLELDDAGERMRTLADVLAEEVRFLELRRAES